jgi:hypothetical protein
MLSIGMLNVAMLSNAMRIVILLNLTMLSVILSGYAEGSYVESHYADCCLESTALVSVGMLCILTPKVGFSPKSYCKTCLIYFLATNALAYSAKM